MFLTHDQLVDLTHYKRPTQQRAALRQMGVPFATRPDGTPAVASALFDVGQQRATMPAPVPKVRVPHGKATQG